jgi:hypothetical protein
MRSLGGVLIGFKLFVPRQRARPGPPASPVSPEKDSPAHRAAHATRFAMRRQSISAREVGCTTWGQTRSVTDSGSREKWRIRSLRMMMSVTKSADSRPGGVNVSLLAAEVVAMSADAGTGVSARVARRNDPVTLGPVSTR